MNVNTIRNAIFAGGVEGLVLKAFDLFKEPLMKGGEDFLKAHTGGRGVHDETLFQGACAHAISYLNVSAADAHRVMNVINSYEPNERRRIVEIIGQSEQEVIVDAPIIEGGVEKYDKDGKKLTKRTTLAANVRGAEIIRILSLMDDNQMKQFFQASNALDTSDKRIKETVGKIAAGFNSIADSPKIKQALDDMKNGTSLLKSDLETRMASENIFDRWANKIRQKNANR
ncbi:MAG: hypothetical protein WCN88_02060 [Candidatus Falkowbacteria bacterium]